MKTTASREGGDRSLTRLGPVGLGVLVSLLVFSTASKSAGDWRRADPGDTGQGAAAAPRSENPNLSAEVRLDPDSGTLEVHAFSGGTLLWTRPAPSELVLVPAKTEIVILVGKRVPGQPALGRSAYEGFTAFDVSGAQIALVPDTGVITWLKVLSDGRVIHRGPDGVRMTDVASGGTRVWSIAEAVDRVTLLGDESHVATGQRLGDSDEYRTRLYDAATGELVQTLVAPFAERVFFFDVSADGSFAFVRRTRTSAPLRCDVDMYAIGAWSEPQVIITGIAGGPFAADRSRSGVVALASLNTDPGAGGVVLEVRNPDGAVALDERFASASVDFEQSFLRFGADGRSLGFRYDRSELRYERTSN